MPTEKNINTTAKLRNGQSTKPQAELMKELERASATTGSKMVDVYIPEVYKAAFGNPMQFSVNGVRVEIPIAQKIKVPEIHALHAQRLMKSAVLNKTQKRPSPEEVYND
jgi:hypothetical protein